MKYKFTSQAELKPIPVKMEGAFIGRCKFVGKTIEQIEAEGYKLCEDQSENTFNFAVQESGMYNIYFKYEGPDAIETSRDFCIKMLQHRDKYYLYEDIQNLSNPMGNYDIFRYKGSYNCRHHWQKYVFSKSTDTRINKKLVGKEPEENEAVKVNDPVKKK